jgi:hypothetical protein
MSSMGSRCEIQPIMLRSIFFLSMLMVHLLSGIHLRMNYGLLMVVLMDFYHVCGMMKSATFLRWLSC